MQRGRIEIGTVGPHERMHLGIEGDLPKEHWIAERSEEFSRQDGFEVDRLCSAVIELDAKHVAADDLEATNAVDVGVPPSSYSSASMGWRGRSACGLIQEGT